MTKVIHLASPRAGAFVQTSAHSTTPTPSASTRSLERQQAIENALSMALHFVRQPGEVDANVWAATARTNRALTLLKQASDGIGATRMKRAFYEAVCSAPGNTAGRV